MPKKTMAKKSTAKPVKKAVEKKVAKVKVAKVVKEPMSKSQLLASLVETTDLSKKQVSAVLESLTEVIYSHLRKNSAGAFNFPGLLKLHVVRKPATKARKGTNPFTGEEMMFKAKPARNVIKARVLKKLKDIAA